MAGVDKLNKIRNKIILKISDDVATKLLECVEPCFSSLLLKKISIESQIRIIDQVNKSENQKGHYIGYNVNFALKPITPYVELSILVDEVRTLTAKITFSIDTDVKIGRLQVYSSGTEAMKIDVKNLVIALTLSISKFSTTHLKKSIEPPIELGKKEFEIVSVSTLAADSWKKKGFLVMPDRSQLEITPTQRLIGRRDLAKYVSESSGMINSISRGHITVFKEGEKYYVEDGETIVQEKPSANKTWLVSGGQRKEITAKGRQELKPGDQINLADIVTLSFTLK